MTGAKANLVETWVSKAEQRRLTASDYDGLSPMMRNLAIYGKHIELIEWNEDEQRIIKKDVTKEMLNPQKTPHHD